MTNTVLSAMLFGAEDLRMVEQPIGPCARHGPGAICAGGICGSDMHYFRHGRTGDFVVTSPLVLGHEIAGELVEIACRRDGPEDRRPGRRQSLEMVRALRTVPGRAPEPVREHLFHGVGIEDAAYARWLRDYFDAVPAQCVKVLTVRQ